MNDSTSYNMLYTHKELFLVASSSFSFCIRPLKSSKPHHILFRQLTLFCVQFFLDCTVDFIANNLSYTEPYSPLESLIDHITFTFLTSVRSHVEDERCAPLQRKVTFSPAEQSYFNIINL